MNKAIKHSKIDNGNKTFNIRIIKYSKKLDFKANQKINKFFSSAQALLGIKPNWSNIYI